MRVLQGHEGSVRCLAYAPDGPFCVANTATGTATFYDAQGKPLPLVVTIPAAPGQPLSPLR